jgi:hypothetical protein
MRPLALAVVVCALTLACVRLLPAPVVAHAAPSERFVEGQTYLVIWACFPVQPQPCYVEALTVKAVHSDGWIDVIDEGERKATGKTQVYTVNPAQMLGFSLKAVERVARR